MSRFAFLSFLFVLPVQWVETSAAQREPANDSTPAAARDARKVVDDFVEAAGSGKVAQAMAYTTRMSTQSIEEWPEDVGVSTLTGLTVLVTEKERLALAVSDPVKILKPNPDGRDTGRLSFELIRSGAEWRIRDIDFESETDAAEQIEAFKRDYADAREIGAPSGGAESAAERHRELIAAHASPERIAESRRRVRDEVVSAFEVRQRQQRAELAEMQQRLRHIQRLIESRERIKDRIIDRRVEELLNPALKWEPSTNDRGADIAQMGQAKRPVFAAVVTGRDGEHVEISVGADDGIKRGMQFDVFDNQMLLGQIEVVRVEADASIARIVKEYARVPIRRGDRLTSREAAHQDAGGGSALDLGAPGAVEQSRSPRGVTQFGGSASRMDTPPSSGARAQVLFRQPRGATLAVQNGDDASTLRIPARLSVNTGDKMRATLSTIPGHEGLELAVSVQLASVNERTRAYLDHNAVPLSITSEDVDQATSGNLVTKVIYLPHPDNAESAVAGVETLATQRLDPGVDPLAAARQRGVVLAVLQLGNRVESSDDPPDSKSATSAASQIP